MREQLIAQHKQLTKQLFRTPAKACTDKRLKYVRYADDFLIAINGTREECEEIKAKLTDFVRDTLKMELSQEKTLITHSNTPARFLGFDVRVRRDSSVKRSGKRKMRTMNNKVELNIPLKDKVETYLLSHSIAKRDGKRLIPIQEAEAAEVNEMVRTAKVTPEQLAALLRQSANTTPNPAALSAVGATFNKEDDSNEDDE